MLLSVPKASCCTHSSGDSSPFLLWEPFPVYFSGSRMGMDPRHGWSESPGKVGVVHVSSEAREQQSWDLVWCPGRPVLPFSWGCRPGGLRHYPHRGHPVEGAHLVQPRRRKATRELDGDGFHVLLSERLDPAWPEARTWTFSFMSHQMPLPS